MSPILIRLKEFREAKGWTQAQLAELSNIPQPTISRIEGGKTTGVDFGVLGKLAEALDVDAALLIIHQRPPRAQHRGFELIARPLHLADSGKWTTLVNIRRQQNVRQVGASNTFDTELEAIVYCFEFGRKVIDGEIPDCSVEDL